MQCAKHQVTGFSEGDRVVHTFAGTNFANHDHVGRLSQSIFQRHFPTVGINADFTLGDDATLVFVNEFDRVFNGDDVAGRIHVAIADHRGQRRRFTGTGRAYKQNNTALGHCQGFDNGGQT